MPDALQELISLVASLRDPVDGSAWERAQSLTTLIPYTIEEAYEVADAAERGDMTALKQELGDLLLQVVFSAQIASETNAFAFEDVARSIVEKIERRHPHRNGSGNASALTAAEINDAWERRKVVERAEKAKRGGISASVLDDVAMNLPAMTRAAKIQSRLTRAGFDWPDATGILDKIEEEIIELRAEILAGEKGLAAEEYGDLLFVMVRLGQRLEVDPEAALRAANAKVDRRFRHVETRLRELGQEPSPAAMPLMDDLWREAKHLEK